MDKYLTIPMTPSSSEPIQYCRALLIDIWKLLTASKTGLEALITRTALSKTGNDHSIKDMAHLILKVFGLSTEQRLLIITSYLTKKTTGKDASTGVYAIIALVAGRKNVKNKFQRTKIVDKHPIWQLFDSNPTTISEDYILLKLENFFGILLPLLDAANRSSSPLNVASEI